MSDNSPNSLKPQPKEKAKHKKFYYCLFAVLFSIVGILVYNIHIAPIKEQELKNNQVEIQEPNEYHKDMVLADGSGLFTPLGKEGEQSSGIMTPQTENPTQEKEEKEPLIIVRGTPQEIKINDELAQIKKQRTQDFLSALRSPLVSKQFKNEKSGQDSSQSVAESQNSKDTAWISENARTQGQDFEIKTGAVIPAVMVTGINSDLAGNLIAQVSQDVYDSTTGEHLLVPQGSKLFGVYESNVVYGQSRVLVAWNRIIFPDGSALTLPAMPGADMAGNSGFKDKVNNHYFRTFGSAILMSFITGGTSYALDNAGSSENENSLQSQMMSSLAQQIGETSAGLLEKNLNIKPTLEVRSGYQFNIVLTKDLVFESPYTAWR